MPTASKSVADILEYLPKDLQITLGMMVENDDLSLDHYTIASLGVGSRTTLRTVDLIMQYEGGYGITGLGVAVQAACYERHKSYIDYRWAILQEANARREADKLPEELQQDLALLVAANDHTAVSFITLLPRADRIKLKEAGVIEFDLDLPLDDPVMVELTDKARGIMAACHRLQLPEEAKAKLHEFEEARSAYFESLP